MNKNPILFAAIIGNVVVALVLCVIAGRNGETVRHLNDRIERLEEAPAAHSHEHAEPRSPQWPKVRAAYIAKHPLCECCGEDGKTTGGLEAHHCQSFHEHPELELDPTNLIALCRRCHLLIGHLADFKRTNAHVREDAALIRKHIEETKHE